MKVDIPKQLHALWWQEKKHPSHEGVTGADSEGYYGGNDGMFVFTHYGRAEQVAGQYKQLHDTKVLTWHLHGTCETCKYSSQCVKVGAPHTYWQCMRPGTEHACYPDWYCAGYEEKK
jgi:hypothetical protein